MKQRERPGRGSVEPNKTPLEKQRNLHLENSWISLFRSCQTCPWSLIPGSISWTLSPPPCLAPQPGCPAKTTLPHWPHNLYSRKMNYGMPYFPSTQIKHLVLIILTIEWSGPSTSTNRTYYSPFTTDYLSWIISQMPGKRANWFISGRRANPLTSQPLTDRLPSCLF